MHTWLEAHSFYDPILYAIMHAVESLFFSFRPTPGAHATSRIGQKSQPANLYSASISFLRRPIFEWDRAHQNSKVRAITLAAPAKKTEIRKLHSSCYGGQRDEGLEPSGSYMLMFMFRIWFYGPINSGSHALKLCDQSTFCNMNDRTFFGGRNISS